MASHQMHLPILNGTAMKPLIETQPRTAPTIAGVIGAAMTIMFGLFDDRSLIWIASESVAMAIAMYYVVKSLRDRRD
jgi:hypothetical protein